MSRLKDKVAIITGGASGIGAAVCKAFINEDAKIIIADLNEEKGKEVAKNLGENAEFIKLNALEQDSWSNLIDKTLNLFGQIDVLVNSAGNSIIKNIEEATLEDMEKSYTLNVTAPFLGMKSVIKEMKKKGGSIINVGSLSGVIGLSQATPYSTSKGALRLLTKSSAVYCAKAGYNIRINTVNPSYIKTPMLENVYSSQEIDNLKNDIPVGRMSELSDVTNNIIYLASDDSQFITGSDQNLDGGFLAGK